MELGKPLSGSGEDPALQQVSSEGIDDAPRKRRAILRTEIASLPGRLGINTLMYNLARNDGSTQIPLRGEVPHT